MRLLIALCLLVSSVYAQVPGEVYLTPKIDLQLQPVAVAGLEDRTLNVPPGFIVELFAEDVGKGRLMAWSPDSVLHVAVMGTRGNNEWRADPNRTGRVCGSARPRPRWPRRRGANGGRRSAVAQ